ncbi:hypothetical protein ABT187_45575 [Streptomyces sp. NPDC001817]|uniref:hypothetical protein n=1 Tax=Streptomyces sp. NPDC001817 TaxID=3154398 RepID=UPI00332FD198
MGVTGGRDLRALFSTNDSALGASEAFTNREMQWELLAAALASHMRTTTDPGFDVEDMVAPRDNVIVFHGVGGIGKTTLSRKLEAALADAGRRPAQWGEPAWPAERILPVRIDLARSANTDFERLVLTIRLALTRIGRPLPAFDLALRRYWEINHPGESLEEYLRRAGLASRFGQALPQHLQSALADIAQELLLPGTVGSVSVRSPVPWYGHCASTGRPLAPSPPAHGWRTCWRPSPTWTRYPITRTCSPGSSPGSPRANGSRP